MGELVLGGRGWITTEPKIIPPTPPQTGALNAKWGTRLEMLIALELTTSPSIPPLADHQATLSFRISVQRKTLLTILCG